MSIMTATFVRLHHGRNLTLVGIAITTMVAGAFVLIRDIPFGVVTVVVYAISAVRTTAGLSLVMREEVRVAERMRSLAATDTLTGLPNRSSFAASLQEALERTRSIEGRLAILTIDLNGFKEVNDLFGHDAGDELLVEVADRLRDGADGHLVARQGGDEFSVLVRDAAGTKPSKLAESIHGALADPVELSRVQVTCGASIGIAYFPDHGDTTAELTTRADLAMYAAKGARRRTLTYSPENGQVTNQSLRLVGDLAPALAAGQITMDYRPIQRLTDRTIVGADAEVIWQHPDDGTLMIKDMEGLLGLASFGGVLRRWGLDLACGEAARRNLDPAPTWTVGIRVLARSLGDSHLIADVAVALQKSGLAAERLCIHVPESLVLRDTVTTSRFFEEVGQLGVQAAIDDFGTAHTSLVTLSRMTVTSIRLAPVLAHTLTDPRTELAIASVLDLADDLGFRVVAQGLDTLSIAEHAKEVGIRFGTGTAIGEGPPPARPPEHAGGQAPSVLTPLQGR